MRIIEPIEITPDHAELSFMGPLQVEPNSEPFVVKVGQQFQVASLVTNVPVDDYPAWVSGTYALGATVIYGNHIYESLADGNTAATTDSTKWLDRGATNPWRMFDGKTGVATTNPESIVLKIAPGRPVDALAFFGVDAASVSVRAVDPYLGIVYENSISPVTNDDVHDWYSYFFSDVQVVEDFVMLNIPAGSYGSIDITISKPDGIAKAAELIIGKMADLGTALFGTSVGIIDYSRKDRDEFGNPEVIERGYSKRAEFDVSVPTPRLGFVQRTLAKYRAKPIVWIGAETHDTTIIYGYYREFNLVISNVAVSDCSISVEGLV